jgi:hypothetical protein
MEVAIPCLCFYNKRSVFLDTEGLVSQPFHERVVVLCNEHSTGAAEMLAQFAKGELSCDDRGRSHLRTPDLSIRISNRSRLPFGRTGRRI